MALSGRSQLAMLGEANDEAVALGTRAERLARRIGDDETVAHALTNVGSALSKGADAEQGRALLDEAFTLAAASGHDDHAARALVNLALGTLMRRRDDPRVADDIDRGLRFAIERGLDGYVQYLLGARAGLRLLLGDWPAAEADAHAALELGEQPGVSVCPALTVLGRLRARRGDPEALPTIDDAWRVAVATGELQRLAPVAATRAEHAWLDGDLAGVVGAAREIHALADRRGDAWARGELGWWLWRAGAPVAVHDDDPAPYARDRGRLARRGRRVGRARLPLRAGRGPGRRRRRGGTARGAAGVRRPRRRPGRVPPAPPPAGRRRAPHPARPAPGLACRAGRAHPAPDRGPRPGRRGCHQRRDRRGAGDHPEDGRPPRLGRPRQARGDLAARGRRGRSAPGGRAARREPGRRAAARGAPGSHPGPTVSPRPASPR